MLIQMKIYWYFPSDKIKKIVMFEKMMPEKKNTIIISNKDREDVARTHWWSISNISPTSKLLFFDSVGIADVKNFIVKEDKKLLTKF